MTSRTIISLLMLAAFIWYLDSKKNEYIAIKKLINACLGDKAQAERLMTYERRKKPGISKTGAALMAFERMEHDRR